MKAFFKYCLLFYFLFIRLSAAAPGQTLDELKRKITEKIFSQVILEDYEFYLLNNKVEFEKELSFLKSLNSSFETQYLQALILFRQNDFNGAFNKLIALLEQIPGYYPYYDLLVKTADITNKQSEIEQKADAINYEKYKNYLKARLAYQKAEYKKAKELFHKVTAIDSTAFQPNYMLAYAYRSLGKYNTALKYFNNAVKPLKKNDPLEAKVRIAIGSLFYLSGKYDKAKEFYESGAKIASATGYNTEKAKALLNIGMLLDLTGKINQARANFDEAIKLASEISDNELEAVCLSEYAVSFTYTGEKIKAREKYEKSFQLFKKLKNKKRLALTAINIGNSYLNIANYKSSIKYFEIGLNEAGENVRTKMLALRGLGDVYTNLSDYSKALEYYSKSKELATKINDIPADAKINIGLGVLYYNLDMPERALKILKESEGNLKESETPYLKLKIEQKIGIIYISLDSLSLANSYLEKSADLAKKYRDIYSEILSNTFLANIAIKRGDVYSGYSLLYEAMSKAKTIGYNQLLGLQNLLMSDISKVKSDKRNQIEYINTAIKFAEKSNDYNTLIRANKKLGEFYENEKDFSKAKVYYSSAIDLIDMNFYRLFTKADIQIKFFSNYYPIYNSLINIYLSENNFEKAFQILEKSKGRNTAQNLINLKLNGSTNNDDLLNRYYDLAWKLKSGLYSKKELTSIKKQFENVKTSLAHFNQSIKKYLDNNNYFSLKDIQHNLDNDQYIISYFVQKDFIYAFKVSSKNFDGKRIDVSYDKLREIKKSISPYYDMGNIGSEIAFNKDLFAFNADGAKAFYENIVQPIISDVPANSKIIFSLPSEMLTIPFELLVTESSDDSSPYLLDDKKFLIDNYVISYAPSASIWSELKKEKVQNMQTALLIGDPYFDNKNESVSKMRGIADEVDIFSRDAAHLRLEYSEVEIKSIGSLLRNDKIFLSKNATETAFKKNVKDASIVHLSTHSFLYKNNPLILFANTDKENDGFLEVGEILQLNLKNDMVVLSSCKSGLGKVDKAEGIIGMQKAFFDAGAKSVIVSLWDVNDRYTSIFMKYFYSFLSSGVTKSEALRFAKIKFIKENSSNPYYWAAFTLSGNDAPINIQTKDNRIVITLIGIFFLFVFGYYLFYSRKFRQEVTVKNG